MPEVRSFHRRIEPQDRANMMNDYYRMLVAYQALPAIRRSLSFMDVAGYPSRENVCSNILAFYLNPAEEHGFGDLLLSSFFNMCGIEDAAFPATDQVRILREHYTEQGKKIDLVIDHSEFTLGVENKIYHWVANDLEEYSREIDRIGTKKRYVLKMVLGLRPLRQRLPGNFQSHTYRELWGFVRERLGMHVSASDPKWLTHFIDFMENTEKLTGSTMELKPTDQFFIENEELLQRMNADRNDFYNRLTQRVGQLRELMEDSDVAALLEKPPWVHASRCLVFDLKLKNTERVSLDLWLTPLGWDLQLFGRGKSHSYALRLGDKIIDGTPDFTDNGRYLIEHRDIKTDLGDLQILLSGWMRSLVGAVDIDTEGNTISAIQTDTEGKILIS